jgi:hypothetical protein
MSDRRKENEETKERAGASASSRMTGRKDATGGKDEPDERGAPARHSDDDAPSAGQILVAFEKLFGGGRGVQRFSRSGLRHVKLGGGAVLVEQNPRKSSEWAQLAREGRRVAWVLRDGEYLARVVDGELTMLD